MRITGDGERPLYSYFTYFMAYLISMCQKWECGTIKITCSQNNSTLDLKTLSNKDFITKIIGEELEAGIQFSPTSGAGKIFIMSSFFEDQGFSICCVTHNHRHKAHPAGEQLQT